MSIAAQSAATTHLWHALFMAAAAHTMPCTIRALIQALPCGQGTGLTEQVLPPKPVGQLLHLKPGAALVSCVQVPPLHGVPISHTLVCR